MRDDFMGVSVIEPAPENNFADPTMLVVIPTLDGAAMSGQITEATARQLIRELERGRAACWRINSKSRDFYRERHAATTQET